MRPAEIKSRLLDHVHADLRDLSLATILCRLAGNGRSSTPRVQVPRPVVSARLCFNPRHTAKPRSWKSGVGPGRTVTSRGHHIAFAVDDVSKTLKIVAAHGICVASPLQHRPDGYKQLYLSDPDGHIVELVSK